MCPQQTDVPSQISPIIPASIAYYITNNVSAVNTVVHRLVYLKVIAETAALTVIDGLMNFMIPTELDGLKLLDAAIAVYTPSSGGLPTVQINETNQSADMLTTPLTIDVAGLESYSATTPMVIDPAHNTVAKGDIIRIDCDVAGTGTTGLDIVLTFGVS